MNPNGHQSSCSRWQHFAHDADLGIRGLGMTVSDAFAQAARALTAAMVDPDAVNPVVPVEIECAGNDPEDLLYVWLNRLVFEMATRRMIFGRFDVAVRGNTLHATAWGEPMTAEHHAAVEVKGATMSELRVRKADGAWIAQCVIDV